MRPRGLPARRAEGRRSLWRRPRSWSHGGAGARCIHRGLPRPCDPPARRDRSGQGGAVTAPSCGPCRLSPIARGALQGSADAVGPLPFFTRWLAPTNMPKTTLTRVEDRSARFTGRGGAGVSPRVPELICITEQFCARAATNSAAFPGAWECRPSPKTFCVPEQICTPRRGSLPPATAVASRDRDDAGVSNHPDRAVSGERFDCSSGRRGLGVRANARGRHPSAGSAAPAPGGGPRG